MHEIKCISHEIIHGRPWYCFIAIKANGEEVMYWRVMSTQEYVTLVRNFYFGDSITDEEYLSIWYYFEETRKRAIAIIASIKMNNVLAGTFETTAVSIICRNVNFASNNGFRVGNCITDAQKFHNQRLLLDDDRSAFLAATKPDEIDALREVVNKDIEQMIKTRESIFGDALDYQEFRDTYRESHPNTCSDCMDAIAAADQSIFATIRMIEGK